MVNVYVKNEAIAPMMYELQGQEYTREWPIHIDEKLSIITKNFAYGAVVSENRVNVEVSSFGKKILKFSSSDGMVIDPYVFPNSIENDKQISDLIDFFHAVLMWMSKYRLPDEKRSLGSAKRHIENHKVTGNAYHIIDIETPAIRYIPKEAEERHKTDIRQRYHMRRGHYRMLKSGKKVWVRSCYDGDKDLGIVHKDYVAY